MKTTAPKIINDPIYGLITFDEPLILEIINHPIFQRMRRISQMGLACFVYPGATHTRFLHTIGACFLMQRCINHLRSKQHNISDEESLAAQIAILFHDLGHGPFSHTLEYMFIAKHHEAISLDFFDLLNQSFGGKLSMAKKIYQGTYKKKFLCQLVKGQLDVDRLDYLARDSFYTGVIEGRVAYDRILHMLNIHNNQIVIEEKGVNSVENFLLARYFMYQQVYHHKTSVVVESMLCKLLSRIKMKLIQQASEKHFWGSSCIIDIWTQNFKTYKQQLQLFGQIDDTDIWSLIKRGTQSKDNITSLLSNAILDRRLLGVEQTTKPISKQQVLARKKHLQKRFKNLSLEELDYLVFTKEIKVQLYSYEDNPLNVKYKNHQTKALAQRNNSVLSRKDKNVFSKHYFCYYIS